MSAAELSPEQLAALEQAVRNNGGPEPEQGSPAEALGRARVDLVERIRSGLPPIEYVPGGDPWLRRGKRYLLAAGAGTGKSLVALLVAVEVVSEGGVVAVLDVENGADEYARRLSDVLDCRDDAAGSLADRCSDRMRYFEWPALKTSWAAEAWTAALAGVDLVVFDSSRLILSAAGLSEDSNDEYAQFVEGLLFPLARAGVTTLVLDNTGHEDRSRARGASAKADLNEVVYVAEVLDAFDHDRTGALLLKRKRTRFAGLPQTLKVDLGGGVYGVPEVFEEDDQGASGWRPTRLMQLVSQALEGAPEGLGITAIRGAVRGDNGKITKAVQCLVEDGNVEVEQDGKTKLHRTLKPYREGTS